MEVINSNTNLLSNYEVMQLIQEVRRSDKKINKRKSNLANITADVLDYFKDSPCSVQSPQVIENFLQATKHLKITKLEKLQLINLRPTSLVMMFQIFEVAEDRFSDSDLTNILKIIEETLPAPLETTNVAEITKEPETMAEYVPHSI